jgi:hypothetical protein
MLKYIGESEKVLVCSAALLRSLEVITLLLWQNSVNLTCEGPDGFGIIEHSGSQVILTLSYVLAGDCWLLFLYVCVQLIRAVLHMVISFYLPVQGHQVPFLY